MKLHTRICFANAAIVVLALAVPSATTRGQDPRRLVQPDSIPLPLAQALISAGGFNGEPQILVGSLPGWITSRLYIPAQSRIVGSAFLGTSVVGVISVPSAPDSLLMEFKRELLSKGWKVPPSPRTFSGAGFMPAPTPTADGSLTRLNLCGDDQFLMASVAHRQGGAAVVVLRVVSSTGPGICNLPQIATSMVRTPWPTLYNPVGAVDARMSGDCSATLGGSSGIGTTLRTSMSAESLLDHYARQLKDSGWVSASETASIVGRSWSRVDSAGVPTELSVTVTTPTRDAGCRELFLQTRNLRKP